MSPQDAYKRIIREVPCCTIATVKKDGHPEAATIAFAEQNGIFYFNTQTNYRKYVNLKHQPVAALVITAGEQTVQIEGDVEELENPTAATAIMDAKRGKPSRFAALPELKYFALHPRWIRILLDPGPPSRFVVLKDRH